MLPVSATPLARIRLTPIAVAAHLALASAMLSPLSARAAAEAAAEPATTTMAEVRVIGSAERGYSAKSTSTATKTDTLLRDTPQAITVVTKELMRDQGSRSMADVIQYVPGLVTAQGEGNRDTVVFRGSSSTGDFFIDGIRDDVQYYRDFYNIDSVEALKGANAMIFGRGGSGGVINRVSKQPEWRDVGEASLTLGAWGNRRATADVGQAINETMALRVNGVMENSDSYRHGVNVKREGINPTLAIRAGARTSVVLGYEHFKDERVADRGIPSLGTAPYRTEASTFFGDVANSKTWARVDAFTALVEHDFGGGVTLRNRSRYASYDKFYQNIFPGAVKNAGTTVDLSAYNNATERNNLFNQTDLNFSFDSGAVKHKIATGLELGRQQTENFRNTGFFGGKTTHNVSIANPVPTVPVSFAQSLTDANNDGTATVASVYLQDQIEFSPRWQAVVGLRADRFSSELIDKRENPLHPQVTTLKVTDSPLSPRVGLVYKPVEAVSLYGSYSIAYVPRAGDQLASLSATNKSFEPEEFRNKELGLKWDVSPDLSASAAVYKLDRSNVAVTDVGDSTKQTIAGAQHTKGVELGLSGKLTRQWSVMGGYAYMDSQLTGVPGSTTKGGVQAQVPKHTFSLWNRYDFTPSLAAALGVVYRDSLYTSTNNTVTLPAFTRFDGAVFYTLNKHYKLQMNVENMFDKQYYASANSDNNITPGSPRSLRVTLNAKF